MTAREKYEKEAATHGDEWREIHLSLADAALAEADAVIEGLTLDCERLSDEYEQAEERIKKLNAGHAAQVEAIVQTRDHVEKKLTEAEASVTTWQNAYELADAEARKWEWVARRAAIKPHVDRALARYQHAEEESK